MLVNAIMAQLPLTPGHRGSDLRVSWAPVESERDRRGIERYLADQLRPSMGYHWPKVEPIPVNLPEPDLGKFIDRRPDYL